MRGTLQLLMTSAAVLSVWADAAMAQNVSNEAWLGQVGGSNVLDIVQEGRGNSAGADNVFLLLQQDGVDNALTLVQSGYDNKLGTLFGDQPEYARGVQQRGDLNLIVIGQRNTQLGGSNMIGSIQQLSTYNLSPASAAFNSLSITQSATGAATGLAGHYVGRIVQTNTTTSGATNLVTVTQDGGGDELGNVLANLRQIGSGNSFALEQTGQLNRIGEMPPAGTLPVGGVIQEGTGNAADVVQSGLGNLLEYVDQRGEESSIVVAMVGDQNVISQVLQNNESWSTAAVGNRISIAISGSGNGGAFGVVGDMLLPPALGVDGVLPSVIQQLGDDNDITLAIADGVDNKYGMSQFGDGNDIYVTVAALILGGVATDNETAIFQDGDANSASHRVRGDDNAGAISQLGHRNNVSLLQTGEGNIGEIRITGDDNNGDGSALFGPALALGLTVGEVSQLGDGNSVEIDLTGSDNVFAVSQTGQTNRVQAEITGGFNALGVLQEGTGEVSISVQSGTSNSLAVHQF